MANQTSDLARLLAEGKTYFWVLRHALRDSSSEEAKAALAKAGIDLQMLAALKQLESSVARFPYPMVSRVTHSSYLPVTVPPDTLTYFNAIVCEHGVEAGTELFPSPLSWTFIHREIQYCIGGDTPINVLLPDNREEHKRFAVGDVVAMPAGARLTWHTSEEDGRYGHAHLFLTNLGDGEPQNFYDIVSLGRLQGLGMVAPPTSGEAPELVDVGERIEVKDWRELLSVRPNRERDLPTWLRNGWAERESTRALDYAEGTKAVVVSSPDRELDDFLPWGKGETRCYVNPIIAEHTTAVTDCLFPAGYHSSQPHKELWTVLNGQAKVRQLLPPIRAETMEAELEPGMVMVVPDGAVVTIEDASEDFVVRRLAESCAHNAYAAMMETKLEADGIVDEL